MSDKPIQEDSGADFRLPHRFGCAALSEDHVVGEVLLHPAEGLKAEVGLFGLCERIVQKGRNLLEPDCGEELNTLVNARSLRDICRLHKF